MEAKERTRPAKKYLIPLAIAVMGTTIGTLLASGILSLLKNIDFGNALAIVLRAIKIGFLSFVRFRIPLWIALIAVLVTFATRPVYKKIKKPAWKRYTIDEIEDWLFAWEYSNKGITNIQLICKNCFCLLSGYNKYSYIGDQRDRPYCPKCNTQYKVIAPRKFGDIAKIILNKIATKEYKKSSYFPAKFGSF
jgi:hypothetical protein